MSAVDEEARASREETILRIRRGIRAAQLRITLDEVQGRQTPEAVVRLAQLRPPKLPSPLRHVENAGREALDRSGVTERIGHACATKCLGRTVAGRPGRAAGPADSRSREAPGPDGASHLEVGPAKPARRGRSPAPIPPRLDGGGVRSLNLGLKANRAEVCRAAVLGPVLSGFHGGRVPEPT